MKQLQMPESQPLRYDDRPPLEIYCNNPYDTPANDLITDLLIPLR